MMPQRERRLRPRARIALPVRVRQVALPRDSAEETSTMNVSRNGILFKGQELYPLHATVWVSMPYDPMVPSPIPDFPASVVRVDLLNSGEVQVALRFHSAYADPWKPSRAVARR